MKLQKKELLIFIETISISISRKRQKNNRRKRILENLENKNETGLHQLRRNIYKGIEEITNLENLKLKLEENFNV